MARGFIRPRFCLLTARLKASDTRGLSSLPRRSPPTTRFISCTFLTQCTATASPLSRRTDPVASYLATYPNSQRPKGLYRAQVTRILLVLNITPKRMGCLSFLSPAYTRLRYRGFKGFFYSLGSPVIIWIV